MKLWTQIKTLFCGGHSMTLKNMKLEQLKREQLGLQNELHRIDMESTKNERTRSQLENDYRAAHEEKKESSKRIIARKLQSVTTLQKGIDSRATHANRMHQVVSGVIILKENMEYYETLGFGRILESMNLKELESYINESFIEGSLQQEKLVAMLQGIDHTLSQVEESDGGIRNYMDKLDRELIETEMPQMKTVSAAENHDLAAIDRVVTRGLEAARQMQKQERVAPVSVACEEGRT